jgi:organic radical activating enzyme
VNLIVTNYCNRSCPYCFAKNKVKTADGRDNSAQKFISLRNVDLYLDFLEQSSIEVFKILGGEPSLHPHLPEIISSGLSRGLKVQIFTNGLWPKPLQEYIESDDQSDISFIFNVNEPSLQQDWETLLQHKCLRIAGKRACISFNIYRDNFDFLFAADLIDDFSLRREVRIGIANPIIGCETAYLGDSLLKKAGKRLVRQLIDMEKRDILGSLDCGFTFCMFDENDLGTLALTTTQGFSSICGSIIDVGPDLTAWPCFPLSEILNVNLLDFQNHKKLAEFYSMKTSVLRSFGSTNDCISCKYLKRHQCTGGCFARVVKSWQESGDPRILNKMEISS